MHPHLVVAIELQRKEIDRVAGQGLDRRGGLPFRLAHQCEPPQPPRVLDHLVVGTVGLVVREAPYPRHRREVVENVLESPPPEAARHLWRPLPLGQVAGALTKPVGVFRQCREPVDPALLEGDPVRAHIALLDHMHEEPAPFGDADRGAVQRPAVAKQDDVADRPFGDQAIEKLGPFVFAPAKVDAVGKPPEHSVAAVEVDPVHGMTAPLQRRSEPLEKPRRHSLQEQKTAIGRFRSAAGEPLCHPRPIKRRSTTIPRTQAPSR